MAKVNAAGVATQYVAEGQAVPADLPPGVQLVGPGSGELTDDAQPEPEAAPEAVPGPPPEDLTPPASSPVPSVPGDDEDGPPDYASYPLAVLRQLARDHGITQHGAKKEDLAAALAQWDFEHPGGD